MSKIHFETLILKIYFFFHKLIREGKNLTTKQYFLTILQKGKKCIIYNDVYADFFFFFKLLQIWGKLFLFELNEISHANTKLRTIYVFFFCFFFCALNLKNIYENCRWRDTLDFCGRCNFRNPYFVKSIHHTMTKISIYSQCYTFSLYLVIYNRIAKAK